MTAFSGGGIGDLVVVLQKDDEAFCGEIKRWRTAGFSLPLVALPLIEKAVLGCSDELPRAAAVIRVVGLMMSGQRNHCAVMEIVVPQRVEPITAALGWAHQLGLLRLVLADNESRSAATCRPHLPDDGSENMIF